MNCVNCGQPEAQHTYESCCIANPHDGIFGRILLPTSYKAASILPFAGGPGTSDTFRAFGESAFPKAGEETVVDILVEAEAKETERRESPWVIARPVDAAAALFAHAQELHAQYWDALHELENALGFEIELDHVGGDLGATTLEDLRERFGSATPVQHVNHTRAKTEERLHWTPDHVAGYSPTCEACKESR